MNNSPEAVIDRINTFCEQLFERLPAEQVPDEIYITLEEKDLLGHRNYYQGLTKGIKFATRYASELEQLRAENKQLRQALKAVHSGDDNAVLKAYRSRGSL